SSSWGTGHYTGSGFLGRGKCVESEQHLHRLPDLDDAEGGVGQAVGLPGEIERAAQEGVIGEDLDVHREPNGECLPVDRESARDLHGEALARAETAEVRGDAPGLEDDLGKPRRLE